MTPAFLRPRVRARRSTAPGTCAPALTALRAAALACALTATAAVATAVPAAHAEPVRFQGSGDAIGNPERGVFRQQQDLPGDLYVDRRPGERPTVMRGVFRLDSHRGTDTLPRTYLDRVGDTFADARAEGVKVAVRFSYNFDGSRADAPLRRVLRHIEQLGPVLRANADTIQVIEAGFIGSWGEWHSSSNGLDSPEAKRAVLAAELEHFPASVKLAVRYPRDKRAMFGTTPVPREEAHGPSGRARVGYTNDCFLAGHNDGATWTSWVPGEAAAESAFVAQETDFVPMGGETCAIGGVRQATSGCPAARSALAAQGWTLLNGGYYAPILGLWRSGGCWEEIERRLGYRFALVDADVPAAPARGSSLGLTMRIRNDGYAAPYNARPVEIVLRHRGSGAQTVLPTGADPRFWLAGQTQSVTVDAAVPGDLAPGSYDLLLHLPDPSGRLRGRPEFSIRMANEDVWEPESGYNVLRRGIQVR
jgi:hypothetical protein